MPVLVLPYPQIDPVLISLGPLPIRWYALAYIAGLVAGWLMARRLAAREALWGGRAHPDAASMDDLLVYCTLGVIVGGRLGNALLYDFGYFLIHPLEIFKVWNGGMAFHGGLAGALIAIWIFARRNGVPLLAVTDICAAVAPVGILLGRIANFIKPELWGRPSDAPWAMVFPDAGPLARHPSQLYEAGLEGLALGLVVWTAARRGALKRPGLVTGLFGMGYALARTFCEFFREPDPATEALGEWLTKGMLFSIPMFLIGLALALAAARRQHAAA
jgi:phosphatidylglycerol---prolipoprotein diacylglyceryl transferase